MSSQVLCTPHSLNESSSSGTVFVLSLAVLSSLSHCQGGGETLQPDCQIWLYINAYSHCQAVDSFCKGYTVTARRDFVFIIALPWGHVILKRRMVVGGMFVCLFVFVFVTPEGFTTEVANKRAYLIQVPRDRWLYIPSEGCGVTFRWKHLQTTPTHFFGQS